MGTWLERKLHTLAKPRGSGGGGLSAGIAASSSYHAVLERMRMNVHVLNVFENFLFSSLVEI